MAIDFISAIPEWMPKYNSCRFRVDSSNIEVVVQKAMSSYHWEAFVNAKHGSSKRDARNRKMLSIRYYDIQLLPSSIQEQTAAYKIYGKESHFAQFLADQEFAIFLNLRNRLTELENPIAKIVSINVSSYPSNNIFYGYCDNIVGKDKLWIDTKVIKFLADASCHWPELSLRIRNMSISTGDPALTIRELACEKISPYLTRLKLFECADWVSHKTVVDNHIVTVLNQCPNLQKLRLSFYQSKWHSHCVNSNKEQTSKGFWIIADEVVEEFLQVVKKHRHLKVLQLSGASISTPSLKKLVSAFFGSQMNTLFVDVRPQDTNWINVQDVRKDSDHFFNFRLIERYGSDIKEKQLEKFIYLGNLQHEFFQLSSGLKAAEKNDFFIPFDYNQNDVITRVPGNKCREVIKVPAKFMCRDTLTLFKDPVIDKSGKKMEKKVFDQKFPNAESDTDETLKNSIQCFLSRYPCLTNDVLKSHVFLRYLTGMIQSGGKASNVRKLILEGQDVMSDPHTAQCVIQILMMYPVYLRECFQELNKEHIHLSAQNFRQLVGKLSDTDLDVFVGHLSSLGIKLPAKVAFDKMQYRLLSALFRAGQDSASILEGVEYFMDGEALSVMVKHGYSVAGNTQLTKLYQQHSKFARKTSVHAKSQNNKHRGPKASKTSQPKGAKTEKNQISLAQRIHQLEQKNAKLIRLYEVAEQKHQAEIKALEERISAIEANVFVGRMPNDDQ